MIIRMLGNGYYGNVYVSDEINGYGFSSEGSNDYCKGYDGGDGGNGYSGGDDGGDGGNIYGGGDNEDDSGKEVNYFLFLNFLYRSDLYYFCLRFNC